MNAAARARQPRAFAWAAVRSSSAATFSSGAAAVRGEPIGCIALITRNAAGKTQHIAANYRPRSSLLLLSRLLGEKFAGTPIGEHFSPATPESDNRFRIPSPKAGEAGA